MKQFPHRYIAQITIEAATPLAIGSDLLKYDQDSPVDKDFNNLPYIPGTAIAGYITRQLPNALLELMGSTPENNSTNTKGSNIIISDAFLMDKECEVKQQPTIINDLFLNRYLTLPIRQHTAINELGAAKEHSKFDTEIVFKGSRFKFEIELQVAEDKTDDWHTILNTFLQNNFYLGSGEFNNFGEIKVIKIQEKHFNLDNDTDKEDYLNHNVDLNEIDPEVFNDYKTDCTSEVYKNKKIALSGENSFFHFGAGYGDYVVDNVNYSEWVLDWDSNKEKDDYPFVEKFVIPGTSIKGALAHRVAFHYNKVNKNWADDLIPDFKKATAESLDKEFNISNFKLATTLTELQKQKAELEQKLKALETEAKNTATHIEKYTGINNKAVTDLFGTAKDSNKKDKGKDTGKDTGKTGTVIIKDTYLSNVEDTPQTIFTHNKIDRYTGGTIEGALFDEKALAIKEATLCIKYKKETDLTYLEMALTDLKKGMLPLGGLVNKGHGIFVKSEKSIENEK